VGKAEEMETETETRGKEMGAAQQGRREKGKKPRVDEKTGSLPRVENEAYPSPRDGSSAQPRAHHMDAFSSSVVRCTLFAAAMSNVSNAKLT